MWLQSGPWNGKCTEGQLTILLPVFGGPLTCLRVYCSFARVQCSQELIATLAVLVGRVLVMNEVHCVVPLSINETCMCWIWPQRNSSSVPQSSIQPRKMISVSWHVVGWLFTIFNIQLMVTLRCSVNGSCLRRYPFYCIQTSQSALFFRYIAVLNLSFYFCILV